MQNKETSFRDNQKTHHPGKNRGMWHAPRGGTWGHNLLYVVLCWDTWPKIKPYGGIRQTQIEEHTNPACQNCQWASQKTEADDVRPREGNREGKSWGKRKWRRASSGWSHRRGWAAGGESGEPGSVEGAGPTDTANTTLTRHMWQSVLKNLQPEVNMATL